MENYSAELDDAEVDESGDAGGDHDGELGEEGAVRRAPVFRVKYDKLSRIGCRTLFFCRESALNLSFCTQ